MTNMTGAFTGREQKYDAPGVIGYRNFNTDGDGVLTSVYRDRVWDNGENKSFCEVKQCFTRCSIRGCPCGFYAYYDGAHHTSGAVRGVIRGWGRVSIGLSGFRCEYAEIVAVSLPPWLPMAKQIRDCYRSTLVIPALAAFGLALGVPHLVYFVVMSLWGVLILAITTLVTYPAYTRTRVWEARALRKHYPDVRFYWRHSKMLRDWPVTNLCGRRDERGS